MKSPVRLLFAVGVILTAFPIGLIAADPALSQKKVLVFTKSSGFEHDAIKTDGQPGHGYAFRILAAIGQKQRIDFVYSKDGSLITPEYLAQFDAFFFYTTGDLTKPKSDPRGDGLPPMTPAGKAALLAAIAGGKGFIGTHSTSDTFHSFGRNDHVVERFENDGDNADDFVKMLGGKFIRHGAQQKSHLIVADAKFPGVSAVPAGFGPLEEWYSLKNFAPDLHVLLVQDTTGMTGAEYDRAPYPSTWVKMHGKGRVFYTNMGHREDVWDNPVFQSVLIGGLNWAVHNMDADVTPNIEQVAPKAGETQNHPAP